MTIACVLLAFVMIPVDMFVCLYHCYRHNHQFDLTISNFRFTLKCSNCGSTFVDENK